MADEDKIRATLLQMAKERGLLGDLVCIKDNEVDYVVRGDGPQRMPFKVTKDGNQLIIKWEGWIGA